MPNFMHMTISEKNKTIPNNLKVFGRKESIGLHIIIDIS
jgi:hypothetical protein